MKFSLKVGLSPSKKIYVICFIESPLRMMKNAFYLILKALVVLKIFKFLSWLFGHVEETAWLERDGWFQNSWRHNLFNKQSQYSYCPIFQEVKSTRESGQLIDYNKTSYIAIFFFKTYAENKAVRLVPDLFLFYRYAEYEIKASGLQLQCLSIALNLGCSKNKL